MDRYRYEVTVESGVSGFVDKTARFAEAVAMLLRSEGFTVEVEALGAARRKRRTRLAWFVLEPVPRSVARLGPARFAAPRPESPARASAAVVSLIRFAASGHGVTVDTSKAPRFVDHGPDLPCGGADCLVCTSEAA